MEAATVLVTTRTRPFCYIGVSIYKAKDVRIEEGKNTLLAWRGGEITFIVNKTAELGEIVQLTPNCFVAGQLIRGVDFEMEVPLQNGALSEVPQERVLQARFMLFKSVNNDIKKRYFFGVLEIVGNSA